MRGKAPAPNAGRAGQWLAPLFEPDLSAEALSRVTLGALARFVDADTHWINRLDLATRRNWWSGGSAVEHDQILSAPQPGDLDPLFAANMREHPLLAALIASGTLAPARISDFVSSQSWRETALYRSFYLEDRVRYQLAFAIDFDGSHAVLVNLNRSTSDFSHSEVESLVQAQAVIQHAWALHAQQSQLKGERDLHLWRLGGQGNQAPANSGNPVRGLILLDQAGGIEWESPNLREMLHGVSTRRSPEKMLEDFLRKFHAADCTAVPWTTPTPRESLAHEIILESGMVLRMQMQLRPPKAILIEAFPLGVPQQPLSRRECEIIHWIRQGKLSSEIGCILGISGRTVAKHLQNAYAKLQLRSRTSLICPEMPGRHADHPEMPPRL